MSSVNKVIIVGRLGSDPEVRYTQSGKAACNFTVATSEQWKDKDGSKQERTEWHRVTAWDKLAELCGEHLSKGRQVYIEGKLQTRKWQDKSGADRYTTEVVATQVTFLGGKGDGGGGGERRQGKPQQDHGYGPPPMTDDDVAF